MECFIAKASAFCFKHEMLFDERTNRRTLFTSLLATKETHGVANTRGHTFFDGMSPMYRGNAECFSAINLKLISFNEKNNRQSTVIFLSVFYVYLLFRLRNLPFEARGSLLFHRLQAALYRLPFGMWLQ